ncbi:uncharacterized protein LOC126713355 isoform X2 [Quercus robur]|uniref:uncharacterized protein LOC126713355 isoform X2 n=1 Tax=Quercus robur TaxID=38942 RepID=UPI00216209FA|nr:uncharacterized protein LOC126713355 isoform X2 [Quercus robur]
MEYLEWRECEYDQKTVVNFYKEEDSLQAALTRVIVQRIKQVLSWTCTIGGNGQRGNFKCTDSSVGVEAQLSNLAAITQVIDPKLH